MSRKFKTQIGALASAALLVGSFAGPASADNVSVDVSNSRAQVIMNKQQQKSSDSSAPVNENRDASDSPVVQPVASMKGQTCIAAGGVEVPCETDDSWFYAPESCYASTPSMAPYARKRNYTTFECKPVGKDVPSLAPAKPVRIPTSEAEARASAAKKGAQLAEDALADYDFERLTVRTQPSDANLRSDAFVFTQGYVWAWVPPSKARASSKRNPIVVESTDGDAHVQLKISFMAMNVYFDGQKTGTQGFIQCDDAGQIYGGEPRGGSNCSWKAKKQDMYKVTSSILYRVEWTAGDESGVLIHEVPMDGAQMIRVQDGYAVNVK